MTVSATIEGQKLILSLLLHHGSGACLAYASGNIGTKSLFDGIDCLVVLIKSA